MELATGARVKITGRVVKGRTYGNAETTLIPISYPEPIEVLVLGKSQRQTGTVVRPPYWEEDGSAYLGDIVSHAVWVVMPLDKHYRFREPIAVLSEQIIED